MFLRFARLLLADCGTNFRSCSQHRRAALERARQSQLFVLIVAFAEVIEAWADSTTIVQHRCAGCELFRSLNIDDSEGWLGTASLTRFEGRSILSRDVSNLMRSSYRSSCSLIDLRPWLRNCLTKFVDLQVANESLQIELASPVESRARCERRRTWLALHVELIRMPDWIGSWSIVTERRKFNSDADIFELLSIYDLWSHHCNKWMIFLGRQRNQQLCLVPIIKGPTVKKGPHCFGGPFGTSPNTLVECISETCRAAEIGLLQQFSSSECPECSVHSWGNEVNRQR